VVKNPTTTIPHHSHLSDEAEILLDERIRQIRKQVMKDLEDSDASGHDKIHAIRSLLALEGYGPDELAAGWRKMHDNNFHRF
jgi:hypothetical protein